MIHTTLIDQSGERIRALAKQRPEVLFVQGDPTDPRVLRSEGTGNADVVLALTGWDEVNCERTGTSALALVDVRVRKHEILPE